MALSTTSEPARGSRRRIGVLGTVARLGVGLALVGDVAYGHVSGTFRLLPWLVGLVGFPALVVAAHRWGARRVRRRIRAAGPLGHAVNVGILLALYLTWWYAPALNVTSDAVLLFYGASMLLAGARGYGGCEVLAFSNWVLRRDDEVGCLLFFPVDHLDDRAAGRGDVRGALGTSVHEQDRGCLGGSHVRSPGRGGRQD